MSWKIFSKTTKCIFNVFKKIHCLVSFWGKNNMLVTNCDFKQIYCRTIEKYQPGEGLVFSQYVSVLNILKYFHYSFSTVLIHRQQLHSPEKFMPSVLRQFSPWYWKRYQIPMFFKIFQYWEHQGGHKKMSKALNIPHLGQWQNNSTCSSISSSMRRPLMMEPMRSQPQLIKLPNCLKAAALWLKQLNVGEHLHNIWTHVCLEEFMVWWDQNLAFCS